MISHCMINLKGLQSLLQRGPEKKDYPKHVIINLYPLGEENKEKFESFLKLIGEAVSLQITHNLPILTLSLGKKDDILDQKKLMNYCEDLLKTANEHKININVFGRWYDLSGELVESLKKLNTETEDFDHFFLNLCINYDGQQEIADACRVIIRKILDDKEDVDSITPDLLKENIYSSYFIPPDLIIEPTSEFKGTFLWDSSDSTIYHLDKKVLDINKSDIQKVLDWYANKH